MKPIVIYRDLIDGKVQLTREEFEQLLENTYNAGYEDGKNSNYIVYPYTEPYPSIPTYKTYTNGVEKITINDNTNVSNKSIN